MRKPSIPSDLRTLMTTRPGERVAVDSVLCTENELNCARHSLRPGMIVQVRDVGPEGVVLAMTDGSDLRIAAPCAAYVQVEPVNEKNGDAL